MSWQRNFATLWCGQAASLFGSAIVQFALVWWLTSTTGSATVLAIGILFALLPAVLLGPFAGVVVDRFDRRAVMLASDSAVAAATLVIAWLFWTGAVEVWHVYAVLLFRSAAGTFQQPALQASTSLMVPAEQLTRIAGFNHMLQGFIGIVAPPAGALLIAVLPMSAVMLVDTATALAGILALLLTRIPRLPPRSVTAGATSFLHDLRDGFRYIRRWPGLLALLVLSAVINLLLAPAASLMPILVTKHFGGGAPQLAAMESTFSLGLLAGGLLLGVWGGFKRRIYTSLMGLVLLGSGFVGMGLMPATAFWPATGLAFFISATASLTNGPIMAVLQSVVAPEMQGRVFALVGSVISAVAPLSLLVAGPVADALGVQFWYIAGGLTSMALAVVAFGVPAIRGLEDGTR